MAFYYNFKPDATAIEIAVLLILFLLLLPPPGLAALWCVRGLITISGLLGVNSEGTITELCTCMPHRDTPSNIIG